MGTKGSDAPPPDPRLTEAQIRSMEVQDDVIQRIVRNSDSMLPLQREATQFALDQLTLNELMSQQSCFAFGENNEFPVWGVVRAVETSAIDDDRDTVSYRFTLVPRMWTATQVIRSSIFQGENVIDIAKKLLKEKQISEDMEKGGLEEVQKLTDQFVTRLTELSKHKEEEIMKV